jgi:diacylglycerol kinase family enzyme
MNVTLVVNPFATRVSGERLERVRDELERAGELEVVMTQRPGHATELVAEAGRRGAEAVVVFSGDGGFNEALNGLERDMPIGFLPGGGTSVLPRALGLPRDGVEAAKEVADALSAGRTRRISLGRVNGRRFGFNAGIGFDAELVRRVDALGRKPDGRRPGDLAFAWGAVRTVAARRGRYDTAVEIDGLGRAAFALIANCDPYSYAGRIPLRVAPLARFELGVDVVAPRSVRGRDIPRLLSYLLRGKGQIANRDVLYGHDLDRFVVRCDYPLPLQLDGEDLGDITEALVESERDAVTVLV